MRISKLSFGLAALALVAAPAIAQSSFAPAVAPLSGDEEAQSEGTGLIVGILGFSAIIAGVVVAASSGDQPASP